MGWNDGYTQMGLTQSGYGSYNPAEQAGIKNSYDGLASMGAKSQDNGFNFSPGNFFKDDKGAFSMDNMSGAMDFGKNMYGIYDSIWGSGADKREYMTEGLAAMKDNRRLAQQTMQNNMTSYDNNLSRQQSVGESMGHGPASSDPRKKLGTYDNQQRLA